MLWVVAAMLPGIAAATYFYGPTILLQCGFCGLLAVLLEGACLVARGIPRAAIANRASDGSILVTGLLIALACPPGISWWVLTLAVVAGVGIGKHAFGGLGQNVFNPAMVGYAVALVSVPAAFALWPQIDGTSGATALEITKHRGGATLAEAQQGIAFARYGGWGQEVLNLLFLLGGLLLVAFRFAAWRIPLAVLLSLSLGALLSYDGGSSASLGGPLFHLASGGTMLAAFFVATDPATHPNSKRAQWVFGTIIGVATLVMRGYAAQPDGIAFAVLLANATAPYLERRWP